MAMAKTRDTETDDAMDSDIDTDRATDTVAPAAVEESEAISLGSSTLMQVLNALSDFNQISTGKGDEGGEGEDGDDGDDKGDDAGDDGLSLDRLTLSTDKDRSTTSPAGETAAESDTEDEEEEDGDDDEATTAHGALAQTGRRGTITKDYMTSSLAALQDQEAAQETAQEPASEASKDVGSAVAAGAALAGPSRRASSASGQRTRRLTNSDQKAQAADGRDRTCAMSDRQRRVKLAKACRDIFHLADLEEVVAEYPCWLLRSVLLQGYLYLTTGHLLFYAYLPKTREGTVRQGLLSKKASRTRQYWKHWFVLQNAVLSWYESSTDLYFPISNIDLRYALAVEPSAKNAMHFKIITAQKVYRFATENQNIRDDWVRTIRKTMFRTRNEGDSVKIAIPLEIVVAVERGKNFEFADTLRVRVQEDAAPQSFVNVADGASSTTGTESGYHVEEDHYDFAYFPDIKAAHRIVTEQLASFERAMAAQPIETISGRPPAKHEILDTTYSAAIAAASSSNEDLDQASQTGRKQVSKGHLLARSSSPKLPGPKRDDTSTGASGQGTVSKIPAKMEEDPSRSSRPQKQPLEASQDTLRPVQEHSYPPSGPSEGTASADESGKSWSQWIRDRSQLHRFATTTPLASNLFGTGRLRPGRKRRVSEQWLSSESRPEFADATNKRSTLLEGPFTAEPAGYISGDNIIRADTRPETLSKEEMPRDHEEHEITIWSSRSQHAQSPKKVPSNVQPQLETKDLDELKRATEKFHQVFALQESEKICGYFSGYMSRMIPTYGKLYISRNYFCFRSTTALSRLRMKIPLRDIQTISPQRSFRPNYHGMMVMVKGHEELFFEFGYLDKRDSCLETLGESVEAANARSDEETTRGSTEGKHEAMILEELEAHQHRLAPGPGIDLKPSQAPPLLFQSTSSSDFITWKPTEVMHITCLTIGSRGDVQPYIALCKALQKDGHRTRIATHGEYKEWIEGHGIEFGYVGGDPAELMRICVENGMFTYSFLREGVTKFRTWIDDLLLTAWQACQGTNLLIESPSAMAGYHVAEALSIPYFRAFTMPWSRTRAYPHAFGVRDMHMGGGYNYSSYVIFDQVFWRATAGQINRWRKRTLHLQPTSLDKMDQQRIPFLYNFSPSIVPPPLDWHAWIQITGYWFLDQADDTQVKKWEAPQELVDFLKKARSDGKKVVYIGFGSIVVSNPDALTEAIVEAVLQSDVRCILSKGWSDRLASKKQVQQTANLSKEEASKKKKDEQLAEEAKEKRAFPDVIYPIKSIPHDWLFPRIDAAVHHGGAGTTGASLRAGIVTVIRPYFGDQYFWAERVQALGVGSSIKKINVASLSDALKHATQDQKQIDRARLIGEKIRSEDGVHEAVRAIYWNYEYALSLVKKDTHLTEEEDARIQSKRRKGSEAEPTSEPKAEEDKAGLGTRTSGDPAAHDQSPDPNGADGEHTLSDWSVISGQDDGHGGGGGEHDHDQSRSTATDDSGYSVPASPHSEDDLARPDAPDSSPSRRHLPASWTSSVPRAIPSSLSQTLNALLPGHHAGNEKRRGD